MALSGLALASCAAQSPGAPPEIFELANIRPSNIVPKSSPATLVSSFRRFCAEQIGDARAIPVLLRASDYVEVPGPAGRAMRSYVVDDSRPMVMLAATGSTATCAVAAESRTGQSAAIARMVAEDHPDARELDPARISPATEVAWLVDDDPVTILFASRFGTVSGPANYVIALHIGAASGAAQ